MDTRAGIVMVMDIVMAMGTGMGTMQKMETESRRLNM